jgi:internalin A
MITDVSPLSGLENLTTIYLKDNLLADVKLSRMEKLWYIDFSSNQITNLKLSDMPDLIGIDLRLNPLADLSPLSGLKNITYLSVSSNDLAPIYNFQSSKSLSWQTFGWIIPICKSLIRRCQIAK